MVRPSGTLQVYPPEGFGPPKDRRGHAGSVSLGLPPGTQVFSADDHISLSEDIFFDRAPAALKDRVPRVIYRDDAWNLAAGERQFLPKEFTGVLTQYDPLPGSSTGALEARMGQLEADGVMRELAFPNALMALLYYPDTEVRELCFRVYNEYLADLQEQARGRFYGVGLINWWDADGARRTLAELKSFGVRTFVLPLKPGNGPDGKPLDYNGPSMSGLWEAIEESGLPIAHHIGEAPLSAPCATNVYAVGMIHNVASFREMFGRYVLTGLLDRHPTLRIGWFEGGINWVPAAIQDAEHMYASFRHMLDTELQNDVRYYWDTHMYSSFMYDPLGLDLVDRIGIDRVMWSSDFPHNESTFGYSEKSLAAVVGAVGPEEAAQVVSGNVVEFLGLPS